MGSGGEPASDQSLRCAALQRGAEGVTPWARLIQTPGIVPEPGEDLLTCRCLGLLEAVYQPPHLQDIVLAGLLVLQGMELVNSPVLDLSELAISRRTRYKGTHSIHHKSITLLVERNHLLQGHLGDVIALWLLHAGYTEHTQIMWIDKDEPAMAIWFGLFILARASLVSMIRAACHVHLGMTITNKILDFVLVLWCVDLGLKVCIVS